MYEFTASFPWATLRIEAIGAGGDLPELDLERSLVAADETCILAAVADLPITVRVTADEADVPEGDPCVFDGCLVVADGQLAVADLVGDDLDRRFRVTPGEVRVRLFADDPHEARRLSVLVGPELVGADLVEADLSEADVPTSGSSPPGASPTPSVR
ncbi:hypothetical protein I0C86_04650 [Plantactinospora sp. S1510]|uniref:Uncharacterized protein n=1 Tax=Plantactinospora alkalitolerans TaxID=2789879 RepID=A0ABS0GQ11_9ACTN|nr:hypothetical protein [Plantactinospora alkalitolerans]MBF9128287.1 hypothetical protein [Plantactinospora alkalitolerans]